MGRPTRCPRPPPSPAAVRRLTASRIGPGHLDGVLGRRVTRHHVLGRLPLREVDDDVRLPGRHVEHVARLHLQPLLQVVAPADLDRAREHVERALAVVVIVGARTRPRRDPEDPHVDVRRPRGRLRDLGSPHDAAGDVALDRRGLDELHVVIPVNCPPVMFRTWPWMKFDHGEHRKNTPPAASCGVPGRPMGMSMPAIERIWSGMPSCTVWPSISMMFSESLEAVSRVSIQPKATALTLILNWPHSLASVLVRPTTPALPDA